jgi:4-diphosphocytidyl-2-C-methyl-D-erythritol kinase
VAPNARLELEKHLPVASGIGGGSADAAATLRALNGLWALDWSEARLAALGRSLGADVAAFFCGARSALMRGVGEAVTPLALPLLHAVLANPRAPLATAAVYAEFDRMGLGRDKFTDQQSWNSLLHAATNVKAIGNDLAPAAVSLLPAITAVMDALGADSRSECAALSGSGATVFALAPTRDAAESLARDLASRRPWWVRAVALAGP